VAVSESPAHRFGTALIALARALERIAGIIQHPGVLTDPVPPGPGPAAPPAPPAPAAGPAAPAAPPAGPAAPPPAAPPEEGVPQPKGERARRAIPQHVKIAVSARDAGQCRACGSTRELHFDHVIPISRGGANTVANIQLLCGGCNRAKGAK